MVGLSRRRRAHPSRLPAGITARLRAFHPSFGMAERAFLIVRIFAPLRYFKDACAMMISK
jgi:hypothetical protein